jgi:serine/threonine protein kinase
MNKRGNWHGTHAIKEIKFDVEASDAQDYAEKMRNFKEELLNLRKTRHANLILFVGACMQPDKCAIVTSFCRGMTLHKYLHNDTYTYTYTKPTFDWIVDVSIQIAQGMGYLHNKQMIHKDLRSKNIFIDGNKAIIADFGLYSITKLCKRLTYSHIYNNKFCCCFFIYLHLLCFLIIKSRRSDFLPITKECLYYMAPELVKLLGTAQMDQAISQASDVYAFGFDTFFTSSLAN